MLGGSWPVADALYCCIVLQRLVCAAAAVCLFAAGRTQSATTAVDVGLPTGELAAVLTCLQWLWRVIGGC